VGIVFHQTISFTHYGKCKCIVPVGENFKANSRVGGNNFIFLLFLFTMWLSCICVHLLVTVCPDTTALNYYLQSRLPFSLCCSLPSGIFSFSEFIPFPFSIPMVSDYSRTIMFLVTIVLHVKRVLTNDKDELAYVCEIVSKLQFSVLHSVLAHIDDGLHIDIHMYACL